MPGYAKEEFQWWKDALAGKTVPMHDVHMQGFYALRRSKDAVPEPVAIWYKNGHLFAKVGVELRNVEWVSIARNPIPHDTYKAVMAGEPWPSEIRFTRADGTTDSSMAGHNSGGDDSNLLDDIIEWTDRAKKMRDKGVPENQEEADTLSDVATKLSEMVGKANKARLKETQPLRDEVDTINDRWNSKLNPAAQAVADLKTQIGIFQRKEKARRAEEAAKLVEQAKASGVDPETVQIAPQPVRSGTRGRAVSLVKVAVVVYDDRMAAAKHLVDESHEEFFKEMDKIILRLLRAGAAVPGAKLDHIEQAR